MKSKLTLIAASIFAMNMAFAQQEGEPIKAPQEVPLGGFEGCSVAPPTNDCQARIKCYGVGRILGNTPFAVQDATKEAQIKARANLAKFYSEKVKAKDALATASEASGKSTADGGMEMKETYSRMSAEVVQTSAESVLSGFQILGRQVDMNQRTVTIKGGVSCKSQAAAAHSQSIAAKSATPAMAGTAAAKKGAATDPDGNGPAGYKIGPSSMGNMNQQIKNAEDF